MFREIGRSLILSAVTFLICAAAYPALVWGFAQLAFPHRAAGSLVYSRDRSVVGSELIGQKFSTEKYFHSRPSAVDYKADAAGGSNLGPNNPDLRKAIGQRAAEAGARPERPVPVDLVTASGSGLDPHISPEAAEYQIQRVAKSRGWDENRVRALVDRHIDRSGSIIGAPARVNVLKLNIDLDESTSSR